MLARLARDEKVSLRDLARRVKRDHKSVAKSFESENPSIQNVLAIFQALGYVANPLVEAYFRGETVLEELVAAVPGKALAMATENTATIRACSDRIDTALGLNFLDKAILHIYEHYYGSLALSHDGTTLDRVDRVLTLLKSLLAKEKARTSILGQINELVLKCYKQTQYSHAELAEIVTLCVEAGLKIEQPPVEVETPLSEDLATRSTTTVNAASKTRRRPKRDGAIGRRHSGP
jgi:hypothetical protein